jgi:hypothetical protein
MNTIPPFLPWLLASPTPSIRYLALTRLLDRPQSDPEVQSAWQAMKTAGPVATILAGQTETGAWSGENSYYTPKYTSSHWSMTLLIELAADPQDPRLGLGAKHMLEATQKSLDYRMENEAYGWTCLWANLLGYTLYTGLYDHPRLPAVMAALARDALQMEWRCPYNDARPCAWGAARALWGLSFLPIEQRTPQVQRMIQSGLAFLLEEYSLVEADYPAPAGGRIHPIWKRINFPLFYQADIPFVLRTLARLSKLDHPGAQPAMDWLIQRRNKTGRWRGASPFRQRTWTTLGDSQETDRWVSLQAAWVLKEAGLSSQ